LVATGVWLESQTTAVGNRHGGFGEQQAGGGIEQFDAPALLLLDDCKEVTIRVVASQ
jgi:hypothetical protein